MAKATKPEMLRRLRLGDLRRYSRHHFGGIALPNDDAGFEYLFELLLMVSLGHDPARIMVNVIEMEAPWLIRRDTSDPWVMKIEPVDRLIARILAMPTRNRKPNAKALGKRLNLTNAERERLRLWTIHPADMTDEQMAEHRKAKRRAAEQRRRLRAGAKPPTLGSTLRLASRSPGRPKESAAEPGTGAARKTVAQVRGR